MVAGEPVDSTEHRRGQRQDGRRGVALECAAIQNVLVVGKALDKPERQSRKVELDRMAAMLSRVGGRGYQVRKNQTIYGDERNDFDPDFDSELDEDAKGANHGLPATVDSAPDRKRWGMACTTCF